MLKFSPLLFIGLVLFLWARGMSNDDTIMLGMGKNGHLELRSAASAVSLSADQGLHKLGKWFSFELVTRKMAAEQSNHKGFSVGGSAPFKWHLRLPLLAVMAVVIFGLVILMKLVKARD